MNNKVIVHIYVPVLEIDFEAKIPINKRINQVMYLIQKYIVTIDKNYPVNADHILCDRRSGQIYDPNDIVVDSNIRNGSQLIVY